MRAVAIVLAILIAITIPVVIFPTRGVGWVSGQEIFAGILGLPLLIISACLCIYAIFQIRSSRPSGAPIAILVIAALFPATLIGKAVILRSGNALYWNRKNHWFAIADYVNPLLLQYYLDHPERFHRKPYSEQVDVDGFTEFLRSQPSFRQSGIRIRDGSILDPWGRPITLLVDFDHDNNLYGRNSSLWNGAEQPTEASVGLLLTEASERALVMGDYICGRNGFKLEKP
jgi:hypothetical protein